MANSARRRVLIVDDELLALALPVRDSTPKEGALIPRRQGRLLSRSGLPEERVDQRRPAARATAIRAAFHEDRVLDPSQEGFDLVRGYARLRRDAVDAERPSGN